MVDRTSPTADAAAAPASTAACTVPSADGWTLPVARTFSDELNFSFVVGNPIATSARLQRMVVGGALDPTFVLDGRASLVEAPAAYASVIAQRNLKMVLDVGP
ncbi:MAG: hypothetical protein OES24_19600 [Acidimicrobiia bacterium]|nr:hypothetical protein [Acidimicrobiia bacterium]